MGPEAASELEPAGAWEGFCLPGATGWEGSAAASSARGGQQQGWSQPAWPGQHQPLWAGDGCSLGQDGIPTAGCAVPKGGSLSLSPMFVGERFISIARRAVFQQLCTSARRKLGQLHFWVLSQRIGVELACLSAGKAA